MTASQQQKAIDLAALLSGSKETSSEFRVGGVPISNIANQVTTPFFAYGGDALVDRLRRVRSTLGHDTEVYFSIKANPSLGLCQLMAKEGLGAELASIGELLLAQQAGFGPRKVIFAGPGKTLAELEAAVLWGIESVNVESEGELERLAAMAQKHNRVARVSLRVNPKEQVKGAQMRVA